MFFYINVWSNPLCFTTLIFWALWPAHLSQMAYFVMLVAFRIFATTLQGWYPLLPHCLQAPFFSTFFLGGSGTTRITSIVASPFKSSFLRLPQTEQFQLLLPRITLIPSLFNNRCFCVGSCLRPHTSLLRSTCSRYSPNSQFVASRLQSSAFIQLFILIASYVVYNTWLT